ncbi:MAG: DUF4282 domain-containing protein [Myxococcales bacterium]|nr:DUF4282 domain-containing protein [Myxococcales bacterium]
MPSTADQKGFIGGLFDFSFENLIATRVIKVLYGVVLVLLALWALIGLGISFLGLIKGQILAFLVALIVVPIGLVVGVIMMRLYFEMIILYFRTFEVLQQIRDNTSK